MSTISAPKISQSQVSFFTYLFGVTPGYINLATTNPDLPKSDPKHFEQFFFSWPDQQDDIRNWLEAKPPRRNVYFCTSLLEMPKRLKENCLPGTIIWADLDNCKPDEVTPIPSVAIKSGITTYQAIWRADEELEPYKQEEFSKRIAYKYRANGVDPTGWDLTQLLRVPYTYNFKYDRPSLGGPPQVDILHAYDVRVPVGVFEAIELPDYEPTSQAQAASTLPAAEDLPTVDTIFYKYMNKIEGTGFRAIFGKEPDAEENWSAILWKFLNMCFEAGMDEYETFAMGQEAACNKYVRDGRPAVDLWVEVLKAAEAQKRASLSFGYKEVIEMPDITAGEEPDTRTFVDDYYDWAISSTDAVPQYHELAAFMLLSGVMASGIKCKTSHTEVQPNLWGLVLGDSTLTRKTTAMNMAMHMLMEIDVDLVLASTGSIEGILGGLSERPNRTSVFFRDEITGFFGEVKNKEYLSGTIETFTNLYDIPKLYTRRLKKETITVVSPAFVFFGGGIRDKFYSMLSDEFVLSGFLPRFLVVGGETDLTRIRRTGPAVTELSEKRVQLQQRVTNLYERFNRVGTVRLGGTEVEVPQTTTATLTEDAWNRFGDIEQMMVETAHASSLSLLALPTFERMSKSLLKMAIILAASDNKNPTGINVGEDLIVTDQHISKAATYIYRWGNYSIEMIMSTGKSQNERVLDKVLNSIQKHPDILRGHIMRLHTLSSREATDILTTLEDRGHITMTKVGKGYKLRAI